MKKKIVIAFAAFLALSASAGVNWLETSHDFGAFDEDMGPVSTDFRFVNTSSEPVAIVSARASCGCTSPVYPKSAIAPGDTARITVTYDPAARPGRFTKYVGVTLSDDEPMQKLYIKGTVVGSAQSVAQRFPADCGTSFQLAKGALMVGEVAKGQMRTVFLEAYNRSADTIRPRVDNLPPYLEVNTTPEAVPPGEQMTFIFYMHSAKCPLYGLVNDTLYVRTNPDADIDCELPAVAVVREDFSKLSPKQLKKAPHVKIENPSVDFDVLGNEPVTMSAVIRNTGKSPLLLRRVYTADKGVTVAASEKSVKPGKEAAINITVNPAELPGALLNARISLITNDPDNPTATIRAVGQIK